MCTRVWFPPCHLFINRLIVFFLSFWEAPLIDQWGMGKERGVILSRVILVTTSGYMKEEMWHTCSFWKPGWACLNTHTKSTFMSPYRPGRRGRQWPVFPGTKCSLCPPELPRFNGGDCPCSVQRVLRCAWLITVLNAGAGRPPGGERAGRPTWNPGAGGQPGRPRVSIRRQRIKEWRKVLIRHIWLTLKQRWDAVTNRSPTYCDLNVSEVVAEKIWGLQSYIYISRSFQITDFLEIVPPLLWIMLTSLHIAVMLFTPKTPSRADVLIYSIVTSAEPDDDNLIKAHSVYCSVIGMFWAKYWNG